MRFSFEGMTIKCLETIRQSPLLSVALVYATLLIDNMLLTVVVPILPEYFYQQEIHGTNIDFPVEIKLSTTTETSFQQNITSNVAIQKCPHPSNFGFLLSENMYIAILFASKPLVQLLANLAVGPITDKIGFDTPMVIGYTILFGSSLGFALGKNYPTLMVARALQGIGSSCASTAGMALIASIYKDDEERGKMLGNALGGLAMGVLIGPTFGGVVYQFSGNKATPFIILAAATLVLFIVLLCTRGREFSCTGSHTEVDHTSLWELLRDPYILLAACTLMMGNLAIGMLEPGMPIWMMQTMCPSKWELGVAFLPISLSYLIGTHVFGWFGFKIGRYLLCMIGICLIGFASISIPFTTSIGLLVCPGLVCGFGIGMVDVSIFPIMGLLVDTRHKPSYGRVFAIADVAFCFAFFIGPLITGGLVRLVGFKFLMIGVGVLSVLFSPLTYFLRNAPITNSEDTMSILKHSDANETGEASRNYSSISTNN